MQSDGIGLQAGRGHPSTKENVLDAAIGLMLKQGYTATSVDAICKAAGVTKGCFFHYFPDKAALAVACAERFMAAQGVRIRSAPFQVEPDPLDRLFGALDFILEQGADPNMPKSCLIGNLAQELCVTHPEVRMVCEQCLGQTAEMYKAMLDEARLRYLPESVLDTQSLADYFVALMQGTLILYKVQGNLSLFEKNIAHYKNYMRQVFGQPNGRRRRKPVSSRDEGGSRS